MFFKALKVLLLIVVTPMLFVGIWFRSGVFQEPFNTMIAALRLEISSANMLYVNERDFVIQARDIDTVIDKSFRPNWDHVERLGSAFLLKRRNEKSGYSCRMYSSRYMVCRKFASSMTEHNNKTVVE